MGQYGFARWRLSSAVCRRRVSSSVTLPAGGRAAAGCVGGQPSRRRRAGRVGGRAADTARRAGTVTSR